MFSNYYQGLAKFNDLLKETQFVLGRVGARNRTQIAAFSPHSLHHLPPSPEATEF